MSITHQKDLWSGSPVWLNYAAPKIPYSELTRDIKADIAIIGAGVSGATTALELAESGFYVVILDTRPPMRGSTSASTALLHYDLDTPMIKLIPKIGEDNAVRAWRRSRLGLENIVAKTQAIGINCNMERHDALYLQGNILNAENLQRETEKRKEVGLFSEYLDSAKVKERFGIEKKSALLVRDNVSVNPVKFVGGYLQAAIEHKARIYSPVTVTDIQSHPRSVTIITDSGHEIIARHVVIATGYEIFKRIKIKHKKIASSWAFATKKQPKNLWPERPHIWESSKPYLYIRTTPDGRVICGGEDEDFSDEETRDALIPAKTKALQKKLKSLLPQIDTRAEFSWAGCFGETETGLPMMGLVPGMPNCFTILAFGGNGITFSRIAAEIISTTINGGEDPDSALFKIQ